MKRSCAALVVAALSPVFLASCGTSAKQAGTNNAAQTHYPYGIAVSGKPGYVKSPYAPKSGFIDVRGFARGTEVNCPYTAKIFLVP